MVILDVMSKVPEVSVLIATFNTPFQLLRRAIYSVFQQTLRNLEIVLVDDGSTNDPGQQLEAFCRKHEGRILFMRQENKGQSQAINRAVAVSKGKYLSVLDADDEYLPHHLQNCRSQMEKFDLIASTTQTVINGPEDYFVPDRHQTGRLVHVDDCILFATLFGKREVFEQRKFSDGYGADADFYDWASRHFRVAKLDLRSYVYYRNNPDSTCGKMKVKLGNKDDSPEAR
ncbi:Glycosyl transferase family 2 [Cyclobacterium lianum]|uniref:Glycosyl transferase family 2 n=1 Tax=Cyclobacterium lianum TaxID=388280 RepID=A0A1M7PQT6_9BACT|nr:glycosyltransferase family 2 protein [Cyclobacterium lianum]SHN19705.1 Glycosyl transferase family 2 [Cyclobacterium lianum]